MFFTQSTLCALFSLTSSALSASFPPTPEGRTVVKSENFQGASISWKETHICETTKGTKSYAGHVHLPPNPDSGRRSYPVNTFFWFFGARNDPENAPFSLWFQGGPGVPSISAALGENGPCSVNLDSQTTTLNPWSWNENVNMMYIDQPVQVGFSYDVLTNGTIDEIKSPFEVTPFKDEVPETNMTTLSGTFASQDFMQAPNTTDMAAVAIWEVMQVFMESFEPYTPAGNKVSIWGESYGGHYVPTFASYFQKQNARIESGDLQDAIELNLDTVGLINACVDMETQMPFYPEMAYNNSYGVEVISEKQYEEALEAWPQCKNLTRTCRSMAKEMDPHGWGNATEVNDACYYAYDWCFSRLQYPFYQSGLYHFDIMETLPSAFPPKLAAGYLNDADIQQALGMPLNFTGLSAAIAVGFNISGDFVKGDNLAHLGKLLDDGVKVHLMYGDSDYQCNWYGGEALSLAIDAKVQPSFSKSGYADLKTNDSYIGGAVRQHGKLSFARVFNAGHEVPWYQPETASEIFNRVMFNKDVATGEKTVNKKYSTSGPSRVVDIASEPHAGHERYCYLWDMMETCVPDEYEMVLSGSAIIKDFIVLGYTAPNGTDIYVLNGTEAGEYLMGEHGTADSPNSSVSSGSSPKPTNALPQQTSENAASPTGMSGHILASVGLSLTVALALQIASS